MSLVAEHADQETSFESDGLKLKERTVSEMSGRERKIVFERGRLKGKGTSSEKFISEVMFESVMG